MTLYLGHTETKADADLESLLGGVQAGTSFSPASLKQWLANRQVHTPYDHGAAGNGTTDDTTACLTAISRSQASGYPVLIPPGSFKISNKLSLASNQTVYMTPGSQIIQAAANMATFEAVARDNVWIHCDGGTLYGQGGWSAAWSDFASHQDRGINLLGCTNSGVTFPRIRNMAMCGIAILGGTNITIVCPVIEGTHVLGAPLTAGVSIYQFAIVVMHDSTYGAFKNVRLINPTFYNVAMGINSVMNIPGSKGALSIVAPVSHTFIAEHGLYLGTSNTRVVGGQIAGASLDACKVFSGAANEVIENTDIELTAENCGGQAVEFGVSGSGRIVGCTAQVTAADCARGLTIDGDVRALKARVVTQRNTQRSVYVARSLSALGPVDCDIEVIDRDSSDYGVLVDAPTSTRNRIRAKVHRPGQGGGAYGIYVNQCSGLTIESPEVSDDSGMLQDGIHLSASALGVRITGSPKVSGYSNAAIFCDAPGTEWRAGPGEFDALTTAFRDTNYQTTAPNILPVTEMVIGRQSTTAANVVIWNLLLADESAYLVTVRLTGKLAGSAERGAFVASAVFWRDGGGVATLQGSADEDVNIKSASFLGVYAFAVSGNEARLNVNSGATANIDWVARITVTKVS